MNHEKWENATGTTILIVVGLCAGTVSFTHVIAWTVMYGQPVLSGLVNALVTELLQIGAGLEIKRRRRTGRTGWRAFWFPSAVLGLACGMSLIAQLSQASPSWQGRLVATLPMIGFLFTVKLVMGRTAAAVPAAGEIQPRPLVVDHAPDESPSPNIPSFDGTVPVPAMPSRLGTEALAVDPIPVRPSALATRPPIDEHRPSVPTDTPPAPVPAAVRPSRPALASVPSTGQAALDLAPPAVRPDDQTSDRPVMSGRPVVSGGVLADISPDVQRTASQVFRALHAQDGRVTRDRLVTVLRDDHNISISNARAGALLKWMREELMSA